MENLLKRKHWVFDLDGTITRPIFDFPTIKRRLGLPPDKGILEVLKDMPEAELPSRFGHWKGLGREASAFRDHLVISEV